MGQVLTHLAKFCDCFEEPWSYPNDQQSQHKTSVNQQSQHNLPQTNYFSDKSIIFGDIRQIENDDIVIDVKRYDNQSKQYVDTLSNCNSMKEEQDEMEIIDLDKITPIIKSQALKKVNNMNKHKSFPLKITTNFEIQDFGQQPQQQNIDEIFESNQQYFIQNEENQFYN